MNRMNIQQRQISLNFRDLAQVHISSVWCNFKLYELLVTLSDHFYKSIVVLEWSWEIALHALQFISENFTNLKFNFQGLCSHPQHIGKICLSSAQLTKLFVVLERLSKKFGWKCKLFMHHILRKYFCSWISPFCFSKHFSHCMWYVSKIFNNE